MFHGILLRAIQTYLMKNMVTNQLDLKDAQK